MTSLHHSGHPPEASGQALLDRARADHSPDLESHQPLLFGPRDVEGSLRTLLASGRVTAVHDTLFEQVEELVETRTAHEKLTAEKKRALAEAHLGGARADAYGTWVFYPWSGRLVHVLPEAEFRELRTSRNRNKITAAEQERLREAKVGIAGLSVGQATALTVALEEIAGELRLADFDRLSLSNLNRLRAPVEAIGVSKAVLTAREIYGLNPYARVRLFLDGIREENLEAFLNDGGKLSILFEECDDLRMKVRLRERARELRIPVLMETSDRGLFDVERFDEEPERPIFHGLTGALRADELNGMGSYEKVPVVLKIIGATTMSKRMAASLVDIDSTLRTWPQLASAVALGGAINTDVARRILLGQHHGSGRFYVDLESVIAKGRGAFEEAIQLPTVEAIERESIPIPEITTASFPPSAEDIRTLVAYATLAPSGGNCQPWRFEHRAGSLYCFLDRVRARSFLDYRDRASVLAIGAAAENVVLTSRRMGLEASVVPFPDAGDPDLVCRIAFARSTPGTEWTDAELANAVALRVTNRRRGEGAPLTAEERGTFQAIATMGGVHLALLTTDAARDAAGALVASAERVRLLSQITHHEMMSEMRWTKEAVARTRDGLDIETLDLDPTERAGMALLSQWPIMRSIELVGGGAGLERPTRKAIAASAGVGLVSIAGTSGAHFFRAGRAVQRVWLAATARGLGVQPMTASIYMFARIDDGGGAGLSDRAREELTTLRRSWRKLFATSQVGEAMFLRWVRADPPTARSLRRSVDDVLTFAR